MTKSKCKMKSKIPMSQKEVNGEQRIVSRKKNKKTYHESTKKGKHEIDICFQFKLIQLSCFRNFACRARALATAGVFVIVFLGFDI